MRKKSSLHRILLLLALVSCKESIIHDLSEKELHKVSAHLNQNSIEHSRLRQGDGNWSLLVESKDSAKAIDIIETSRLLRVRRAIKDDSNMLPSEQDERFEYERSISNSLEDSLLTLNGVEEARVHIQISSKSPLTFAAKEDAVKDSASVLLLVTRPDAVTPDEVSKLVSGGTGIAQEEISVVIKNNGLHSHQTSLSEKNSSNKREFSSMLISASSGMILVGSVMLWKYRNK